MFCTEETCANSQVGIPQDLKISQKYPWEFAIKVPWVKTICKGNTKTCEKLHALHSVPLKLWPQVTNAHKSFLNGVSAERCVQPDAGLVLADTAGSSSEDELGDLITSVNPK